MLWNWVTRWQSTSYSWLLCNVPAIEPSVSFIMQEITLVSTGLLPAKYVYALDNSNRTILNLSISRIVELKSLNEINPFLSHSALKWRMCQPVSIYSLFSISQHHIADTVAQKHHSFYYPAPGRGTGYCYFLGDFFLCFFVSNITRKRLDRFA